MNIPKARPMTQTSKPVTPKTLIMMSTGLSTAYSPVQLRMDFAGQTRRKTQSIHLPQHESPLPGFMKEYLVGADLKASKKIFKAKGQARVKTTQPQCRRKQRIRFEETGKRQDMPQECKVFRIYRPQVIEISPRSKFTIYSTVNLTNTSPLKRVERCRFEVKQNVKVLTVGTKGEDSSVELTDCGDYLKPALTFGEKLWRLNEVSIFSMVGK